MFGALGGMLPLRLGGSATNGWSASQHARLVADLIACKRTMPIASWRYNETTDTISDFIGWEGAGPSFAPTTSGSGTGSVTFSWSDRGFADPYDPSVTRAMHVRAATVLATDVNDVTLAFELQANGITVNAEDEFGAHSGGIYSVTLFGAVGDSNRSEIGDYGGALDKRDNETESKQPYAARVLSELRRSRGTAYTTRPGTLVHVENVALARLISWGAFRLPEKVRANALPGTSDEKLDYWIEVLGIVNRTDDTTAQLRLRAESHYRAVTGNSFAAVQAALETLFGDALAFVGLSTGATLSSPPIDTYWVGGSAGDPTRDLGGGNWESTRSLLSVIVVVPSGADYSGLISEATVMLDRMLPAWMTFQIIS